MQKSTVTLGEIMLRLSAPGAERFLQTPQFDATFGGGEANVAVSLSGFGLPASFVSVLPDNPIGDAAVGDLRRQGVDTSRIVRGAGRMGIYYLESGANQRPSRVVYDRAGSSIAVAKVDALNWDHTFAGAGWLHLTGITPAISQGAAELTMEALKQARTRGVTVSCDLNFRKNLWKWGKKAPEVMTEVTKHIDVAIANEEDVQNSLGIAASANVHSGSLDPAVYESLSKVVLDKYPNLKSIAITMRESLSASHNRWSACFNNRKEFIVSRQYDITHIVDRVGSGDSFAAGLIYGLQTMPNDRDSLEFAVAASCLKHSIIGDYNRVSVGEVNELLKNGGSGRVQR